MKNHSMSSILFAVALATLFCHGASHAKSIRAADLRARGEIDGWTEEKNSYVAFDTSSLFDLINGGAPEYIDNGLVEGITQRLKGPSPLAIEVFAEDFGTPEAARTMFLRKAGSGADSTIATCRDTLCLSFSPFIGGVAAYAAVERFYFEIALTGAGDEREARARMQPFLRWYVRRIDGR
jgi:hypothetical protein